MYPCKLWQDMHSFLIYSLYFLYDANSDSKVLLMKSAMFEIVHCGLLSVQRSKVFDRRGLSYQKVSSS